MMSPQKTMKKDKKKTLIVSWLAMKTSRPGPQKSSLNTHQDKIHYPKQRTTTLDINNFFHYKTEELISLALAWAMLVLQWACYTLILFLFSLFHPVALFQEEFVCWAVSFHVPISASSQPPMLSSLQTSSCGRDKAKYSPYLRFPNATHEISCLSIQFTEKFTTDLRFQWTHLYSRWVSAPFTNQQYKEACNTYIKPT